MPGIVTLNARIKKESIVKNPQRIYMNTGTDRDFKYQADFKYHICLSIIKEFPPKLSFQKRENCFIFQFLQTFPFISF